LAESGVWSNKTDQQQNSEVEACKVITGFHGSLLKLFVKLLSCHGPK